MVVNTYKVTPEDQATVVTETAQLRALANDVRIRIVGLLRESPRTMRELASELAVRKGSVSYHLGVLAKAGIARQSESRTVRGGTQQRWSLVAPNIVVQLGAGDAAGRAAVTRVLANQMERGTGSQLFVAHVRLNDAARLRVVSILEGAMAEVRELQTNDGALTTVASLAFATDRPST